MPPILPFLFVTLLASAPAVAAGEAAPDLGSSLVQMIGGLAVVVGLLLGSLWLIKRLSGPRGAATGHSPDAPAGGGSDFQNWLAKALERRNRGS